MNCPICEAKLEFYFDEDCYELCCSGEKQHPHDDVRDRLCSAELGVSFWERVNKVMLEAAQKVLDETPLPDWAEGQAELAQQEALDTEGYLPLTGSLSYPCQPAPRVWEEGRDA